MERNLASPGHSPVTVFDYTPIREIESNNGLQNTRNDYSICRHTCEFLVTTKERDLD